MFFQLWPRIPCVGGLRTQEAVDQWTLRSGFVNAVAHHHGVIMRENTDMKSRSVARAARESSIRCRHSVRQRSFTIRATTKDRVMFQDIAITRQIARCV